MERLPAGAESVPASGGGARSAEEASASAAGGGGGAGPRVILGMDVDEMARKCLNRSKYERTVVMMREIMCMNISVDENSEEIKVLLDAVETAWKELDEKSKPPQPAPRARPVAVVAPYSPSNDVDLTAQHREWDMMEPAEFVRRYLLPFKSLPRRVQSAVVAYMKGVESGDGTRSGAIGSALSRVRRASGGGVPGPGPRAAEIVVIQLD